jgi:imidazolonepropionase-like amidohydrolase
MPEAPVADEFVDGEGGTLIPGLIDAHMHLGWRPGMPGDNPMGHVLETAAAALGVGITSARDLGARDHSVIIGARHITGGHAPGPHIIAAGRPVALPGGYVPGVAVEVDQPVAVRDAVQAQIAAGAGVIKVIASPVPADPAARLPRSLGPDNLAAAVDAAHAAGLRITAHAHSLEGARDSVLAGMDCIEHGYRLDDATIAIMAQRGTWLVPTLVAMESAQAPQWGPDAPPERAARARERWEAAVYAARQAYRSGVRIAAGSDAVTVVAIDSIRREVQLLVTAAGLPPRAALGAATADAADLLGIGADTGTIAAGKLADLLLLEGNPLDDPTVLARVRGVWRAGVRYPAA